MSGCGRISSKTVNELADEGYEVEWVSDDSILITEDGEEEYGTDFYTFRFKNGFSADDMTNNRGFHDMKSDYDACFGELSSDEAQRLYDRALELEKEL